MKKLLLMVLAMLCLTVSALADTLYAGPADSGLPSITEAISAAQPGDEILLADGVYDESREIFPIMVDKNVTLRPVEGAAPVIVTPKLTTAMKITGQGAAVTGLRFDHIRCAIWVLADDVAVTDCTITLADETWRTSSSGLWIAGAKHTTLTGNTFAGCGVSMAGPPVDGYVDDVAVLTAMFEVGEDIEFFTTHTMENNTVNGEPLCYLVGAQDMTWTEEVGQIIAVQCENVVFKDLNLDFTSIGIQLAYCQGVIVDGCSASDNGIFGVYGMKSADCVIRSTRTDRCTHGIDIRDSDRVMVVDCVSNECGQGTFLSWGRNCLVQRCEMTNNGVGFFSASGRNNLVDACQIQDNELGIYLQKETLLTMMDTQVVNNSVCGLRAMKSGVVNIGNTFAENFVGHLALDCTPLTYIDCIWTGNEDCDMYVRGGSVIKMIHNTFDGAMTDSCQFDSSENLVWSE